MQRASHSGHVIGGGYTRTLGSGVRSASGRTGGACRSVATAIGIACRPYACGVTLQPHRCSTRTDGGRHDRCAVRELGGCRAGADCGSPTPTLSFVDMRPGRWARSGRRRPSMRWSHALRPRTTRSFGPSWMQRWRGRGRSRAARRVGRAAQGHDRRLLIGALLSRQAFDGNLHIQSPPVRARAVRPSTSDGSQAAHRRTALGALLLRGPHLLACRNAAIGCTGTTPGSGIGFEAATRAPV